MTVGVATAVVTAAACEDLHQLERRRLTRPVQPGSNPVLRLLESSPVIILFTKCPYPSAGSESILKKCSNGHVVFYMMPPHR